MLSKLIAILALIGVASLINVGNFWFSYGIWPKNFTSLIIFIVLSFVNTIILTSVLKELLNGND